jgi:hypothetical protein
MSGISDDIMNNLLSGVEFFGKKTERKAVVLKETDGYVYVIPKDGGRWVYRAQYEAFDGKTVTLDKVDYPAEVIESLNEPVYVSKAAQKREDVY